MNRLHRLDARDRALLELLLLRPTSRPSWRAAMLVLTHLGGASISIALTIALFLAADGSPIGLHALFSLVLSHALVQMLKRSVGRPRPRYGDGLTSVIAAPDRFSFPSGHATAALSVALSYATFYPSLGALIIATASAVGASRVFLGVHYPGDVAAGQVIALVVHAALLHAGA